MARASKAPSALPTDQLLHTRAAQQWIEEGEAQGEATTAEIQALPLEQLEALAETLLDFSGPVDLAAWLAEHNG